MNFPDLFTDFHWAVSVAVVDDFLAMAKTHKTKHLFLIFNSKYCKKAFVISPGGQCALPRSVVWSIKRHGGQRGGPGEVEKLVC